MRTKIFISHRHEEETIANVINDYLQDWGIHRHDIFQSSRSDSGAMIGSKLDDELKKALTVTNLLILVYTHKMYDWSYCTWECGVALDPKTEDTNIVVFECAGESPKIFEPNVRVEVTEKGIDDFTYQFHKSDNFFPNQPAFNPGFADDILKKKAEKFFNDLEEVIPGGQYKEKPLIHLIKLSLSPEIVDEAKNKTSPKSAHACISENLFIEDASPYCPQHFGCSTFDKKMKWSGVIKGWQDEVNKSKPKKSKLTDEWTRELYSEIWRALRNKPAKPLGNIMASATSANRQYIPLLSLMREYPDQKREFMLYLYPYPTSK